MSAVTKLAEVFGVPKVNLGGKPKIILKAHARFVSVVEPAENYSKDGHEYTAELLVRKNDTDTVEALLEGIASTANYMFSDTFKGLSKTGKMKARKKAAWHKQAVENFLAGKCNMSIIDGEQVPNGRFDVIEGGKVVFYFPIRDGDAIGRVKADDDGNETYVRDADQEIGKGGEVRGHWLIRVKMKDKDWQGNPQSPGVFDASKAPITDPKGLVSLDIARWNVSPSAYGHKEDASIVGINFQLNGAQLVEQTEYRILPKGTAANDDWMDDDDEDEWAS